jgi:hypothetical protein
MTHRNNQPSSKPLDLKALSKNKTPAPIEQVLVTHTVTARMTDGTVEYYWIATDGFESPEVGNVPPGYFNGPYATEDTASRAAARALRKYLGPQCKIEDRPGWPENITDTLQ